VRARLELRQHVIDASRSLHSRGWVANHDGNISTRVGRARFLATPTATSKARVSESNLIEVDDAGKRVAGTAGPFSEMQLHLAVYEKRDDVHAVVHAHPPHATALACAGNNLIERPFIAEAVVSLGATIPLLAFAPPGTEARRAVAGIAADVDAVLLANHGVMTWAADIELALLRMELVEHLARIALLAQAAGGIEPLPDSVFEPLLAARARAGLGKAADRAAKSSSKRVIACAPAPHAPDVEVISTVIQEELVKALRDRD
jgi:L-fuculose-phosphate aldolase